MILNNTGIKWMKGDCENPVFKKDFMLEDFCGATLCICGLGFFEAYINGQRISGDYFVPAWSDYEPRPDRRMKYPISDTFTHRVYYLEYNVTKLLKTGLNTLTVYVGNGWYNQNVRNIEGDFWYGSPKLMFELAVTRADNSCERIVSDESLLWKPSHIVSSNIYAGECHDLRLIPKELMFCAGGTAEAEDDISEAGGREAAQTVSGADSLEAAQAVFGTISPKAAQTVSGADSSEAAQNRAVSDWEPCLAAEAPAGELCPSECPPDRIIRKLSPVLVSEADGKFIYDAGENTSGFAVFTLAEKEGKAVHVRYAEELDPSGQLDTASTGNRPPQEDCFISAGKPLLCMPKFTYHGFRYFEVDGKVTDVWVYVIHSDVKRNVSFESSSTPLNLLFEAYLRSQLSNMHTGVVSDCPHRERLGYTGDGQLTADTAMLLLDGEDFYRKWIIDILDCQDIKNGHVQHTAPYYGGGGGPGGWGSAIVLVPYFHYMHYRDRALLARCYPHMVKWLAYMKAHSEKGLVVREEEKGWCLGEWCTLEKVELPEPFVNTYFLIKSLMKMQEISEILSTPDDYSEQIRTVKAAFKKAYYDPAANTYCGGIQGADAFAIDIGMGNRAMIAALAEKYEKLGHFDTGMFGTDILTGVLCDNGYTDLVYDLLCATGPGTFGYLQTTNATTLRERWDGSESHNHHMFGACVKQLLYSFLGVKLPHGKACGLAISPAVPQKLTYACVRIKTIWGSADIRFRRTPAEIFFELSCDKDFLFCYNGVEQLLCGGSAHSLCFPV